MSRNEATTNSSDTRALPRQGRGRSGKDTRGEVPNPLDDDLIEAVIRQVVGAPEAIPSLLSSATMIHLVVCEIMFMMDTGGASGTT